MPNTQPHAAPAGTVNLQSVTLPHLSHNTIRGAAGAAVLNVELAYVRGLFL